MRCGYGQTTSPLYIDDERSTHPRLTSLSCPRLRLLYLAAPELISRHVPLGQASRDAGRPVKLFVCSSVPNRIVCVRPLARPQPPLSVGHPPAYYPSLFFLGLSNVWLIVATNGVPRPGEPIPLLNFHFLPPLQFRVVLYAQLLQSSKPVS